MFFISSFQFLAEILSKCYQKERSFYWKKTTAWGEKLFFESVACVCFKLGTDILLIAFFMGIGFLMGVMTVSFALAIDLNKSLWISQKRLVYSGSFLKDTKVLV